ncbi:MAG: DUF1501 domain-containing protein [Streptosporangiales bacterium]|nr:DUF1501 domain-containing protein [Streptosporangiales bacterium]
MDTVTRRRFLLASGVAAGTALAAGATTVSVRELVRAGRADPLDPDSAILVLVTLYGGNDGLNTVVPAGDTAYQDSRADLAYGQDEVLDLGDGLGLNPSMKGFKALWDADRLAVVRGVSYPRPDHSHFRSMAIWQSASPQGQVSTGWLGRWLDATGRDPLRAIAVGSTLPPMLAGAHVAGAALPLTGIDIGAHRRAQLACLGRAESGEPDLQGRAAGANKDLLRLADVTGRDASPRPTTSPDDDADDEGGSGGAREGALARQLAVVARCIAAGAPTRAYSVSLGGFDTHSNEKRTQSRLLGELDEAVAGFLHTVGGGARGANVVVAVYSEFGRRVAANGSQGTDHGTAGPMFVAGTKVKGGFYGEDPSLTDLDDGDLKATTDFRTVYGELVEGVLGTEAGRVVAGAGDQLGFLR